MTPSLFKTGTFWGPSPHQRGSGRSAEQRGILPDTHTRFKHPCIHLHPAPPTPLRSTRVGNKPRCTPIIGLWIHPEMDLPPGRAFRGVGLLLTTAIAYSTPKFICPPNQAIITKLRLLDPSRLLNYPKGPRERKPLGFRRPSNKLQKPTMMKNPNAKHEAGLAPETANGIDSDRRKKNKN